MQSNRRELVDSICLDVIGAIHVMLYIKLGTISVTALPEIAPKMPLDEAYVKASINLFADRHETSYVDVLQIFTIY
ncbi:unnamed protein product [Protopolystoma xenopodis]|uniref:Uncharacterized protein n=1 Tax=Protopolystoma xenopodis TaxID=117903 RepID=A0A3S5AV23_9PLAT|nr:unnamed protein product [Protopolystoma xenopodis]